MSGGVIRTAPERGENRPQGVRRRTGWGSPDLCPVGVFEGRSFFALKGRVLSAQGEERSDDALGDMAPILPTLQGSFTAGLNDPCRVGRKNTTPTQGIAALALG